MLEQILSGDPTEIVVENIHEYLTTISGNVRSGKTKLDDFIIHKVSANKLCRFCPANISHSQRLGKNPEDYPDGKGQPHVQVALRLKAKGGTAKTGDVMPYVFCKEEGEESAKTAQADRARHPDEVRRSNLQVGTSNPWIIRVKAERNVTDYEYYLSQQVLPPIERLCDPIEGTDRSRLAECLGRRFKSQSCHLLIHVNLGLDPQRYRNVTSSGSSGPVFASFDSQMSDAERFKDAAPFIIRCRGCQDELGSHPSMIQYTFSTFIHCT